MGDNLAQKGRKRKAHHPDRNKKREEKQNILRFDKKITQKIGAGTACWQSTRLIIERLPAGVAHGNILYRLVFGVHSTLCYHSGTKKAPVNLPKCRWQVTP